MVKSCIKCGCSSELLLNLVCCSSPRCQNFDRKFFLKWLSGCGRTYNSPNKDWTFLGRFVSNKPTYNKTVGRIYDLYSHGPEVYAIRSNKTDNNDNIYVGDAQGEPLGYYQHWWSGAEVADENAKDALLEAVARKKI